MCGRGSRRIGHLDTQASILQRWYRLRLRGRLQPLLHEHGYLWRFTNRADPWGSRVRVSWEEIEGDIQVEEMRKTPNSECNHYAQKQSA